MLNDCQRWSSSRSATRRDSTTAAAGVTPAAAVVLSKRVADLLRDQRWQSFSTFRGHPLTVAAIGATVRRIAREALVERADALDAMLRRRLGELAAAHSCVLRVAGLGLHWTVDLRGESWRDWHADTGEPTPADKMLAAALDVGVLISASAEASLLIAPPLIVSDSELETILVALDRALSIADKALLVDGDAQGTPARYPAPPRLMAAAPGAAREPLFTRCASSTPSEEGS